MSFFRIALGVFLLFMGTSGVWNNLNYMFGSRLVGLRVNGLAIFGLSVGLIATALSLTLLFPSWRKGKISLFQVMLGITILAVMLGMHQSQK
jgi:hypothetical protein